MLFRQLTLQMSLLIFICAAALAPQAVTAQQKEAPSKKTVTIVFIGDSLVAGYGVKKEEAFPAKVEEILKSRGHDVKVINGGISGSVSAETDRRVNWFLRAKPDILFLALGANDGLKGTPPAVIKSNLSKAIDLAQSKKIRVVLAGIQVFTNFGPDYRKDFENVYKELSKEKKVTFIPFLLEDVALKKDLNQPDGKHPNAKGHEIVAKNIVRYLEPLL